LPALERKPMETRPGRLRGGPGSFLLGFFFYTLTTSGWYKAGDGFLMVQVGLSETRGCSSTWSLTPTCGPMRRGANWETLAGIPPYLGHREPYRSVLVAPWQYPWLLRHLKCESTPWSSLIFCSSFCRQQKLHRRSLAPKEKSESLASLSERGVRQK
jgi:hypothetical protein